MCMVLVGLGLHLPGMAQDRPFLRMAAEAIDSPKGEAKQTFAADVPWVRALRQKVELPGPITVSTSVVHRYAQEGCARVSNRFTLHEAALVQGRLEPVEFKVEFNVCRDGEPPLESIDIRDVEAMLQQRSAIEAGEQPKAPVRKASTPKAAK